jgi:hypothetical protein
MIEKEKEGLNQGVLISICFRVLESYILLQLKKKKAFIEIEYVKIYIFQMGLGLTDSISWMNLQKKLDVIVLSIKLYMFYGVLLYCQL